MAYTAIVILDGDFLTSFCFDAPHDKAAAYERACEMWKDGSADSSARDWERAAGLVCAVVPGYHEAFTAVGV